MTKHIADRRVANSNGKLRQFMAVDRKMAQEGSHSASRALIKRAVSDRSDSRRLQEFLRIERGISA